MIFLKSDRTQNLINEGDAHKQYERIGIKFKANLKNGSFVIAAQRKYEFMTLDDLDLGSKTCMNKGLHT